jgi:hypothetical protein
MSELQTTFTMILTDKNHVETIRDGKTGGFNTHRPIFLGSNGVEYYRTKDGVYHPLSGLDQHKSRREKDKNRTTHEIAVEERHLPRGIKQS